MLHINNILGAEWKDNVMPLFTISNILEHGSANGETSYTADLTDVNTGVTFKNAVYMPNDHFPSFYFKEDDSVNPIEGVLNNIPIDKYQNGDTIFITHKI